ncbi:MAG: pyridoxal-dependent decarboxylase, exosortase A system-associated [Gammaproteobacteria bacterium]|nr:pyridoxal-dependent decarboxylase, exosortase A system-associated [Gammaproteobacteria bacterium]
MHAPMTQFTVAGRHLQVGGVPVSQLVARVGKTPFYAYDRRMIADRIAQLRAVLPTPIRLHYAIKANPMPAVVQYLSGLGDGLDVASLQEMNTALDTGMPGNHISFSGPGKTDVELKGAVASGVIVNLESEGEMERIARLGEQLSIRPLVSIRINPDFELKYSGMQMGGSAKVFGVDLERLPEMANRAAQLDLDLLGFHIFNGSQNLRAEAIVDAQNRTFCLIDTLLEQVSCKLRWLNIGGGFGIPYFPGESHLKVEPIATNLASLLDHYPWAKKTEIVLELGRYLVGEAGIYICRVVDKKVSRGVTYLVTDGGMHHNLAASGNLGQVIRKNYPVVAVEKMGESPLEEVTIVGPLCTPLDVIAHQVQLPRMGTGDLIGVLQSGAYGYSASPTAFLGHPPAGEILV